MAKENNLLYIRVKEQLIAEIKMLQPNVRLPSRAKLSQKYQVTRTTIDRAISELIGEGYLYARDCSGTYVAENTAPVIETGQTANVISWGVIVRDVTEGFFAELVRGVENVAQGYGINVVLCNSDSDFDKQEQYIRRLSHSVSGIVIAPVVSSDKRENDRLYKQLTELKIPFVFCHQQGEEINAPVVTTNDYHGGYIVTRHLLEKGYQNIAYISNKRYRTSVDRFQGYFMALKESGIEVNRDIIIIEGQSQAQSFGYETMKKFLASKQVVDAVFCFNDKVAQGVYRAITEAGLRVSDDIGVVGYDDSDICEKSIPTITSVALNNLAVGTKAAEVLYKLINKEDLSHFHFYLFQPELIVRDSCLGLKKA
jgi:DNA-binding LacI/PurR family transcriptional regulator